MPIKIENNSSVKLPRNFNSFIQKILTSTPQNHLRGIEKLRIVDQINDPRIPFTQRHSLPGLYHPKQGNHPAWLELSANILFPSSSPLYRRILQRLSFKGNLAAILFSLIGQHYFLTMRHSMRKNQVEGAIRTYTETQLRTWTKNEKGLRSRIFRPFQPTLERWSKSLQRRVNKEKKNNKNI